jgi:hypothetical protein
MSLLRYRFSPAARSGKPGAFELRLDRPRELPQIDGVAHASFLCPRPQPQSMLRKTERRRGIAYIDHENGAMA